MANILPKDCCDCATVIDPCACTTTYLITVNLTASLHYLQTDPDSGTSTDTEVTTTIEDLQIYVSVPPDTYFYGIQGCATSGTIYTQFAENQNTCDGSQAYQFYTFYTLCDEEPNCYSSDDVQYNTTNQPGATVSGSFTPTPSGSNYTFTLDTFNLDNLWTTTYFYDDYSDTTRTGNIVLSQDVGSDQNVTVYLQFGENDTRTIYTASFSGTVDITKVT